MSFRYFVKACKQQQHVPPISSSLRSSIFSRGLAGHSHYHNIRYRKARVDAKKQSYFQRLSKDIVAAIRASSGETNPKANPRLQRALEAARKASMPKDRIEKALYHSSNDNLSNAPIETFQAICAGGIAFLIKAYAHRRNKVTKEIRALLARADGDYNKSSWMFQDHFVLVIPDAHSNDIDQIQLTAIEAGAKEIHLLEDGALELDCFSSKHADEISKTISKTFPQLQRKLYAVHTLKPTTLVELDEERSIKLNKLLDALDQHEDVVEVFHNIHL